MSAILEYAREIYVCMHDKEELTEYPYAGDTVAIEAEDVTAAKARINAGLTAFQTRVAALTAVV